MYGIANSDKIRIFFKKFKYLNFKYCKQKNLIQGKIHSINKAGLTVITKNV